MSQATDGAAEQGTAAQGTAAQQATDGAAQQETQAQLVAALANIDAIAVLAVVKGKVELARDAVQITANQLPAWNEPLVGNKGQVGILSVQRAAIHAAAQNIIGENAIDAIAFSLAAAEGTPGVIGGKSALYHSRRDWFDAVSAASGCTVNRNTVQVYLGMQKKYGELYPKLRAAGCTRVNDLRKGYSADEDKIFMEKLTAADFSGKTVTEVVNAVATEILAIRAAAKARETITGGNEGVNATNVTPTPSTPAQTTQPAQTSPRLDGNGRQATAATAAATDSVQAMLDLHKVEKAAAEAALRLDDLLTSAKKAAETLAAVMWTAVGQSAAQKETENEYRKLIADSFIEDSFRSFVTSYVNRERNKRDEQAAQQRADRVDTRPVVEKLTAENDPAEQQPAA